MRLSTPALALLFASAFGTHASAQTAARQLQLADQAHARAAFLGVVIIDVDADRLSRLKMTEERGVEVTNVEDGSPADSAGVKAGDVLLTYNGETILGAQQFIRLVRETPVGRHVGISLWRNGREQRVTITPVGAQAFSLGPGSEQFRNMARELGAMRAPDGTLLNLQGLGSLGLMPDIPTVIMAWNNSSLGLECEPLDSQLAQYFGVKQGVLVRSVSNGSAAEKAGLKAGDVLLSVGNHPIKTTDDFHRSIRPGNAQIQIAVMRDHKQLAVSVTPASDRQE